MYNIGVSVSRTRFAGFVLFYLVEMMLTCPSSKTFWKVPASWSAWQCVTITPAMRDGLDIASGVRGVRQKELSADIHVALAPHHVLHADGHGKWQKHGQTRPGGEPPSPERGQRNGDFCRR